MRTCEISFAALGTLFLCCVNVVNQNTVALLLLVFCYSYATWHVLVTHLTTYTQHENREAKEKRQDRRILQNRTYGNYKVDTWETRGDTFIYSLGRIFTPQSQWNYFCKMRKPSVGEVNGAIKRKEGAFWVAVTTHLFHEQCFLRSGLPPVKILKCVTAQWGVRFTQHCDIFQNLLAQLVCHHKCSDFRQSQKALFAYCILQMHTALFRDGSMYFIAKSY